MEDKKRHVIKIHIRARRNCSCRDPALQDPARWSCEGLQGGKPGWAPHTQVSEIPYTVLVWLCWYGAGIPHTPGCGVWKLICISGPLCFSAQIRAGASTALQEPRSTAWGPAAIPPGCRTSPWTAEGPYGKVSAVILWPSPNSERGSAAAPPPVCLCLHLPNAMAAYLPPKPPSSSSNPSDVFLHSFAKYTDSVSLVSAGVDQSFT